MATSNQVTLKVKNAAFLCVFATKRGANSISCTQIVEAWSHEHVSIQVTQQYYHFWPQPTWKNTFTCQILQHTDFLLERPICKIMYCYSQWKVCFIIKELVKEVTCIPDDIPALFPTPYRPGLLVLDDLTRNCTDDERILDLFTKVSHRCDVTCTYLTQNLFSQESFPGAFLLMLITSLLLTILEILWG